MAEKLFMREDYMQARYTILITISLFTAIACIISTGMAKSNIVASRYSGGPSGYNFGGGNCIACHEDFTQGPGKVEILGAPRRYINNKFYDITVRITDSTQVGAGFELSAENAVGHVGDLWVSDSNNTSYADSGSNVNYVTQKSAGVDDSIANWVSNGHTYEYNLQWQAPANNAGHLTLFAAGNAVNNAAVFFGDHFYQGYAPMIHAIPGDADGDTDLDLADFAMLQRCFNDTDPATGERCEFVDFDQNGDVSLDDYYEFWFAMTGSTAANPAGYVLADAMRGGLLYDKWWIVNGATEPTGDHPLYPEVGIKTGPTTFRCKECHGWDYKGRDGAYSTGTHFTDILGIENTTLNSREIFNLLKADPNDVPNGHNMSAYGLSDTDLWDLVKFSLEGVIQTDDFIDGSNLFTGNALFGSFTYSDTCQACHGEDGKAINFGDAQNPQFVGTIAVNNPWELMHKLRYSHPGSSMLSTERLYWSISKATDIGAHAQTLPVE